jgi:hypothetical protein
MCPACMASAALMVAGVMSTGGLTALAAKFIRSKSGVVGNVSKETKRLEARNRKEK